MFPKDRVRTAMWQFLSAETFYIHWISKNRANVDMSVCTQYTKTYTTILHGDRLVRLAVVPSSVRGLTFDIKRYLFSPPSSSIKIALSLFFKTQSQAPMSFGHLWLALHFSKKTELLHMTSQWLRNNYRTFTCGMNFQMFQKCIVLSA